MRLAKFQKIFSATPNHFWNFASLRSIITYKEEKMEQKNYFNNLISNEEHFYAVPDCISECSDYKELIEQSFNLTDGQLILESFNCSESETTYIFELTVNKSTEKFEVKKISDSVDTNGLILGLNSILINRGVITQNRFVDLVGGPVDFGIAFISPDKEMNLAKNGLVWRNDQFYIEFENAKMLSDVKSDDELDVKMGKFEKKPWWKLGK